jgi:3-oxoacyl-[acyl-carrier protein] reductase
MKLLVTGGGSGLGREFTLSLARLGAAVAFCDIGEAGIAETESLATGLAGRVVGFRANVAVETDVVTLVHDAHAALGGLNGLINNAGIFRDALLVKQDRKSTHVPGPLERRDPGT